VSRFLLAVLVAAILPCPVAVAAVPSNAAIRKILAERVGNENLGFGIVVGLIDADGRRVVSYGWTGGNDKRPLDGNTVFEIGSATKVFTSLLLTDMARRGQVSVSDPVAKYLPAGVKVPERNGRKITLADLATHTSGLPREPSNLVPKDEHNPYADYSVKDLYEFLSTYELTRDVGSGHEYSNLGMGLLGHALSLRAGTDYGELVRTRICDPLGMASTRAKALTTAAMKVRLAVGHDPALKPASLLDNPTTPGAGTLLSTANDMLRFLAANLGFTRTPLAGAMADEVSVRRPTDAPDEEVAYGWHVHTKDGKSTIWHNGGTEGYHSFVGFDPKARVGVVVLSNIAAPPGVDDIGRHLLDPTEPLLGIHVGETAKRFRDQTQSAGTEPALRRLIEQIRTGTPSYETMTPQVARMIRNQLPQFEKHMGSLGALQSISFQGVGPAGADIYEVAFEHGKAEGRILLGTDGKVQGFGFRE
jgi:D-alanyl-D-alanine-carboxypeptidase/D-alanyl-D-alanine-endopeptidase